MRKGFLVALFALLPACSQGPHETQSPGDASAAPPGPQPASSGAVAATSAAPPAASTAAPDYGKISSCKDMPVDITNETPEKGVVMQNAQTVGDAGTSDRLMPIEAVIKQNANKFRCCFDAGGGKRPPHQEFKVTLSLDFSVSGEVTNAGFDRDETDKTNDETEACMISVAKSLSYPESPSGHETKRFRHRFFFKTH